MAITAFSAQRQFHKMFSFDLIETTELRPIQRVGQNVDGNATPLSIPVTDVTPPVVERIKFMDCLPSRGLTVNTQFLLPRQPQAGKAVGHGVTFLKSARMIGNIFFLAFLQSPLRGPQGQESVAWDTAPDDRTSSFSRSTCFHLAKRSSS